MKAGVDYVGASVGAIVFNDAGQMFLSRRGPKSRNERGTWEFPGGRIEYGEKMRDSVTREFMEEYGMSIEVTELLSVDDHILPDEGQHWVAATFLARHISGSPRILEPEKCTEIGWFSPDSLPAPLSTITQMNVAVYRERAAR